MNRYLIDNIDGSAVWMEIPMGDASKKFEDRWWGKPKPRAEVCEWLASQDIKAKFEDMIFQ